MGDHGVCNGMVKIIVNGSMAERFFVLKDTELCYYLKKTDPEPKWTCKLSSKLKVSTVFFEPKKKQYGFEISGPAVDESPESQTKNGKGNGGKKSDSNSKSAVITAGGVVSGSLTSGLGLFGSMLMHGSSNTHSSSNSTNPDAEDKIQQLYFDTMNDAQQWADAIKVKIEQSDDNVDSIHVVQNHSLRNNSAAQMARLLEVQDWIQTSKWKHATMQDGYRIYERATDDDGLISSPFQKSNAKSSSQTCFKVNIGLNGTVADAHSMFMSFPPSCCTGIIKSMDVIANADQNPQLVHICLHPIYLHPSWTAPRDFCVLRYWKENKDGSHIICLDSTTFPGCPPQDGYVRGEMHAAYYISGPVKDTEDEQLPECMVTLIAQVDPKGWIWQSYGYQQRFIEQFLSHVVDVRDAIDADRFVPINFDPITEKKAAIGVSKTNSSASPEQSSIGTIPPPTLPSEMWTEADASSFRVRGPTYMEDKVKSNSGPSLFKLVAIDVFEVPETTHNISANPKNRVSLAQQRGEKFWAFVLNIMVPGPPHYCFVMYYTGDKTLLEQDTPFGRIAKQFFFGSDDEYRNNRFKLIPKIVDGNIIVKMAVKDTPTLLGNKLKQYYYRDEHYFEIDVDVGSSSVARNIVGIAIGYSKAIVVDMGICLQGNDERELPEVMMGAASCIHVDMTLAKKL